MLKYLVQITEDLMAAGLIIGMLYSYIKFNFKKSGRIVLLGGMGVSFIASVVMAILENTSKKVNIGYTNLTMFFAFIISFIVFLVLHIGVIKKVTKGIGEWMIYISALVMVFSLMFYSLPDVLAYPYNFDLSGNSVFSTDFIYRFIGCILGFVLVLIAGIAVYKSEKTLKAPWNKIFLFTACFVNGLSFGGKAVQIMRTRMMLPRSQISFTIIKITLNYGEYFIFAIVLCAVVASAYQYAKNIKVVEEYSNLAQLRKIKARMRRQRRWSAVSLVCGILAIMNLTVIDAYNKKEPDEAPVEECEISGDNVIVPLTAVDDGHLHRFGYKTEDGIVVKFIVVQKPGTTAYGVGLDACDICGDAGYYEKNDQIVCRRCDVVMNTNTIGFKGGCNPIVIDYSVHDGQIIVPIETLVEHQNEFK